jgi:hypothetical protein
VGRLTFGVILGLAIGISDVLLMLLLALSHPAIAPASMRAMSRMFWNRSLCSSRSSDVIEAA